MTDGIKLINDDQRIKAVIDVLVESFGVTFSALSVITGLEVPEIEKFMENSTTIGCEKKYRLATRVLFLHYVFKDSTSAVKRQYGE